MNRAQIFSTCRDIIRQWGVQHLLMDEVARRGGMSKKTLYELFGSKEALLDALAANFLAEERAVFLEELAEQRTLSARLRFMIQYLIRLGELIPHAELEFLRKKHKSTFRMILHYLDELFEQLEQELRAARTSGKVCPALQPDMQLHLLKALLQYLHTNYPNLVQQHSSRHWCRQISDTFLRSLQLAD